jgi:ribosomal protein S26
MQEDHSALRAEYKCKSYALYCALFLDVVRVRVAGDGDDQSPPAVVAHTSSRATQVFNGLVDSRDSVGAVGALVG